MDAALEILVVLFVVIVILFFYACYIYMSLYRKRSTAYPEIKWAPIRTFTSTSGTQVTQHKAFIETTNLQQFVKERGLDVLIKHVIDNAEKTLIHNDLRGFEIIKGEFFIETVVFNRTDVLI